MKVTDAIIWAPGAFTPTSRPASAAGITPVSRVHDMNNISFKLHFARRSGTAQMKQSAAANQHQDNHDGDAAPQVSAHEAKST